MTWKYEIDIAEAFDAARNEKKGKNDEKNI